MEIVKEIGDKDIEIARENEIGVGENVEKPTEQVQMETKQQKENEIEEERIMRKLIQEWKNLDERFIPKAQKRVYKEAFQKYKEKKAKF